MLRITKTFENNGTRIYKIEGKVADDSLQMWADELNVLKQATGRQVILDFSQTWFVSTKAVMTLIALMPDHLYVLNCPMEMRNIMLSAGLSERML